jgi:anhydro-N-acetylmuramic acid kinase
VNETAALARKKVLRVAGLMSGTSADGISAAVAEISARRVRVLAFRTFPYLPAIRRRIFRLFRPETADLHEICRMNFVIGELFARALIDLARKSGIPLRSIDLVGSHGQTICHLPQRGRGGRTPAVATLQIGEPSVIAERTGITTVADFRPRDIAAGGEGAPLVPYADCFLFRHARKSRAIQNIGGIANVTWLPPSAGIGDIVAFDTGPGNMVMDRVAQRITNGKQRYDAGGRMALRGRVHARLLAELMEHPYLGRRPPKSTGREEFGAAFADGLFQRARSEGIAPEDILATVTAFTSRSISAAYQRFLPGPPDEVILCGGGCRNRALVRWLQDDLHPASVAVMDEFGINADAKEAVSFAILARETIRGVPNNVPSATGAERPVVLGKIIPGGRKMQSAKCKVQNERKR